MSKIKISLAVTHSPWVPERVESMARLLESLQPLQPPCSVFDEKCPNWVWSEQQWRWAFEQDVTHCLFLQDDVRVTPNFWAALKAMLAGVPDQVISIYNGQPGAKQVARDRRAWYTTADGLVGMGYVFPRPALAEFLDWRASALKPLAVEQITEDTLIDVWAIATGRKIWHPVPTLIDHDLSIISTYGNDWHRYRRPSVTWEDGDVCGWKVEDLEEGDFWNTTQNVPHLGRFYKGAHWLAKRWCKELANETFRRAELDVCPSPYSRFFCYP